MNRIYGDEGVAADRIEQLAVTKTEGDSNSAERLSYSEVLCNKRFRSATFMGCVLTIAM